LASWIPPNRPYCRSEETLSLNDNKINAMLTVTQQYNNSTNTTSLLPYYALLSSDPYTCPSPTEILLYLDIYLAFSCIASLTLGTKSVRTSVSHNRFLPSDFGNDHPRLLSWISIAGSLLIHIGATVVTANVLRASNVETTPESLLGRMFLLWLSRPLATALIMWLSIADRKTYHDNAREVAIVDSLYGLTNIYLFSSVARITNVRPSDIPGPARLARAGSALWLLAFLLSLAVLAWYMVKIPRAFTQFPRLLPWIWFSLDAIRFTACWLLWAGLLFSDETAFCPTRSALASVTAIWLFAPFIDCLWRGVATYRAEEGTEAENLIAI